MPTNVQVHWGKNKTNDYLFQKVVLRHGLKVWKPSLNVVHTSSQRTVSTIQWLTAFMWEIWVQNLIVLLLSEWVCKDVCVTYLYKYSWLHYLDGFWGILKSHQRVIICYYLYYTSIKVKKIKQWQDSVYLLEFPSMLEQNRAMFNYYFFYEYLKRLRWFQWKTLV